MEPRPLIGITGHLEPARWGDWVREAVVSPASYARAVYRAGGIPLVLPPIPADAVADLVRGLGETGLHRIDVVFVDVAVMFVAVKNDRRPRLAEEVPQQTEVRDRLEGLELGHTRFVMETGGLSQIGTTLSAI